VVEDVGHAAFQRELEHRDAVLLVVCSECVAPVGREDVSHPLEHRTSRHAFDLVRKHVQLRTGGVEQMGGPGGSAAAAAVPGDGYRAAVVHQPPDRRTVPETRVEQLAAEPRRPDALLEDPEPDVVELLYWRLRHNGLGHREQVPTCVRGRRDGGRDVNAECVQDRLDRAREDDAR